MAGTAGGVTAGGGSIEGTAAGRAVIRRGIARDRDGPGSRARRLGMPTSQAQAHACRGR